MSSESFTQSAAGTLAAWEAEKQVAFAVLDADGKVMRTVNAPGSTGDRKHPVLASDSKGNILLAWTEGMGWKKGGTVSWQVFDRDGNAIGEPGRTDGVPVWGLLSALPRAGGGFTILY
ncbi:MAG: hypothetical protein HY269_03110 [Deltaproteobacteria bacterium]|nr:hypothetical protein [Deltaproteobacteria bacterium]